MAAAVGGHMSTPRAKLIDETAAETSFVRMRIQMKTHVKSKTLDQSLAREPRPPRFTN
jgi:hypothetical protein